MAATGPRAIPSPPVSETVRIIEYEILSPTELARLPHLADRPVGRVQNLSEVGVLRCVNRHGEKVTLVGDGRYMRRLVQTGAAADPAGVRLSAGKFPVVKQGWPGRLQIERILPPSQARTRATRTKSSESNQRRRSA